MDFKDIVNRDIVNLQNCEDEPIHIPGSIQPHGFLIAVNADSNSISVCSENVKSYIGLQYEGLLGKQISEVFDDVLVAEIKSFTQSNQNVKVFNHSLSGKLFSIHIHLSLGQIIIEGELTEQQFNENYDLFNSSRQLLSYVEDSFTLKELANSVAIAVKNITGYDRVMVYRFDNEYNGEVFAESKEEYLEPFLGLHYPHTDIPPQARELYIKNQLRIIGDINYTPVPLYKIANDSLETLDLSLSVLRSVSPIHVQYLQNMGVGGTLTISLLHKEKLWGLIACHHYSPKYLSQEIRNTAKLHAHFITSQIDVRLLNEEYEIARKVNSALENITSKKLGIDRNSIKDIFQDESVIDLCNSVGVSALINGEIYTFGEVPDHDDILKISNYLSKYGSGNFNTSSLARVITDLPFISNNFPGINYYSLGNESDCIIWYRTQTIKEINWAGDPSKSIEKDRNGLSPRKSFELFTENVKDSSRIWLKSELSSCYNFYNFFQIHLRSILLNEEKENQRILSEVLKETNAELENINWISTHDLQEPLRKIRMMASILTGENFESLSPDVQNRIIKMQNSAERMQVLISDILKYTKANDQNTGFETVNLNGLFQEIKHELHDSLEEKHAIIQVENLPEINGIAFLLKQLFSNIIYNSLKFIDPSRKPFITVKSSIEFVEKENTIKSGNYHKIEITDNGIGFDNQYNERIFKIFSKLNSANEYTGSGIGLALCKKIMSKHSGFITANGKPEIGATFSMFFPQ